MHNSKHQELPRPLWRDLARGSSRNKYLLLPGKPRRTLVGTRRRPEQRPRLDGRAVRTPPDGPPLLLAPLRSLPEPVLTRPKGGTVMAERPVDRRILPACSSFNSGRIIFGGLTTSARRRLVSSTAFGNATSTICLFVYSMAETTRAVTMGSIKTFFTRRRPIYLAATCTYCEYWHIQRGDNAHQCCCYVRTYSAAIIRIQIAHIHSTGAAAMGAARCGGDAYTHTEYKYNVYGSNKTLQHLNFSTLRVR